MNSQIKQFLDYLKGKKLPLDRNDLIKVTSDHRSFGLFYTPFKIANLMARLGKIGNPKSILDIACGMGVILYHCDYGTDLEGLDINKEIVKVAKLLNPKANIICGDFHLHKFSKKYDLILGDIPFGIVQKKGNKLFAGEILFIEKALSLLAKNGVLLCWKW